MNEWLILILSVAVASLISLVGGLYLLYGKKGAAKLQEFAVPFAAGALLSATFFDLLPESFEVNGSTDIFIWILVGFLGFFLMERFLRWFHHHHEHEGSADQSNRNLIIIGDSLHNFIDGLAIGAAFLVSPATGIAVTLAVAAHEIPQEIGDFGLLLKKGMKKSSILWVNVVTALLTVVGAAIVYGFGQSAGFPTEVLLALTAGFFIYIAASDIIPSIHRQESSRQSNVQALVLIFGVIIVMLTTNIAHSFIHGQSHNEDANNSHHIEEADHEDSHEEAFDH